MLERDEIALLFDPLPEAILLCDLDGKIIFFNQQLSLLLGYHLDELVGQPVEVLLPAAQRQNHAARRCDYARAPQMRGMNQLQGIMARHKFGRELPVTVSLNPVDHGGNRFIIACLREKPPQPLSDMERLDHENLQLQRLESLGLLSCGIAHDIRNMLTVVAGNAELLGDGIPEQHTLQNNIRSINQATAQLNQLSHQILAFAGGRQGMRECVDLNQLVEETAGLLRVALPAHIRLEQQLVNPLPALWAERSQLAQVLLNLVMNASQAIGAGQGCITLSTGCQDARVNATDFQLQPQTAGDEPLVYMRVRDDGHGMEPAQCARIFEPFYSTRGKGNGLGLAVVRKIVANHEGGIKVQSLPQQGSSFTIYLPAAQAGVL